MYTLVFCIALANQCVETGSINYPSKEECESQQTSLIMQLERQRKEYNYVLCKPGK